MIEFDPSYKSTSLSEVALQAEKLIPGWTPSDELLSLSVLCASVAHLHGDIVEVGSWCGRSSASLGFTILSEADTKLWCVDLWPEQGDWKKDSLGNFFIDMQLNGENIQSNLEHTVWESTFNSQVLPLYSNKSSPYLKFQDMKKNFGIEHKILEYRGVSSRFVKDQVNQIKAIKFAFIDGDHSEQGVSEDLKSLFPLMIPGSIIAFDDAFSGYKGVDAAIMKFLKTQDNLIVIGQLTRKLFAVRKPH